MSASRTVCIVAEQRLMSSLAEQFAALGRFALCESEAPWPDAVVVDDRIGAPLAKPEDLRRQGYSGAIILISSCAGPCPAADARLSRPFRFAALVDAIDDALARRAARPILSTSARLTEKEEAILARLAQANGAVVSKAALLLEVWGYGPKVSTRTLETHIHRLRRKIEKDPAHPQRLVTEANGYRLASTDADIGESMLPAV